MTFIRLYLAVLLLFSYTIHVRSECKILFNLLVCHHTLPSAEMIKSARDVNSVIIGSYSGSLNLQPLPDTEGYSLKSIQLQKSQIDHIDPGYFSKQFGDGIVHLRFNANNGTLHLDQNTLSGLENTLETLFVTEFNVDTTSYLYMLKKLKALTLARVGLKQVPPNFPQLMEHLTKVDLTQNQLTALPWDAIAKEIQRANFQDLRLGGNNWTCDCNMKPIVRAPLELKAKINNFNCWEPPELATLPLSSLKLEDICPGGDEKYHTPVFSTPDHGDEDKSGDINSVVISKTNDQVHQLDNAYNTVGDEEPQIATAGGVSTEVIAVIVAVVFVVVLVAIAVIVFKVRSKKQRQQQQTAQKQPSHKSSAYCHVIEHPSSKTNASSRAPGSATYGRDLDNSETQPLAPSYYGNQDNRL